MSIKKVTNTPWFRIVSLGLLLAVVLLIVFGPAKPSDQNRSIVISDDNLAHLMVAWQRTWQRPPTQDELTGLVRNHVREEVLYREAVNRGMAESNASVRRALIMQMNMLAESQVEQSALTEKEVQSFYNLRKDQYQQAPRISFRQVYFKEESLARLSEGKLQEIIDQLNQSPDDYGEFGDAIMLQPSYTLQTPDQVSNQFGEEFSRQLFEIEGTNWTGPVTSGFGSHLVKIEERTEAVDAPLEQVRDEVVNELLYEEKQAAKEQFYTELLRQYDVSYQGLAKQLVRND
jgi:peptidyl-prolyl cis-trans isomerase C